MTYFHPEKSSVCNRADGIGRRAPMGTDLVVADGKPVDSAVRQ
jgi:hypothetical protein